MSAPRPVRLTLALLDRGSLALPRALACPRGEVRGARAALALRAHERAFARALLTRRTQLWLVRADQRAASGDFVVVDMSSPRPAARPVYVLELKLGARLRRGRPTTHQVRRAARAVADVAHATGAIPPDAVYTVLIGDPDAVLRAL